MEDQRYVVLTHEKLIEYQRELLEDSELSRRISKFLWAQIYILDKTRTFSPFHLLQAIKDAESPERRSLTKPATQYMRLPLRGLWHKHFDSPRFMLKNIIQGAKRASFDAELRDIMDPKKNEYMNDEVIAAIARCFVDDSYSKRAAAGKLTGESIVYIRCGEKNYYLTYASHREDDQVIFDQIMRNCEVEFRDLPQWIAAARNLA